jgi:hypothetical protein
LQDKEWSEQKDERTCVQGENLIPLVCSAIIHQVTSGRSEMTAVLINSPE